MILWSQCFSEPTRAPQYVFIVVNGQTSTSAFHKVVWRQL